jgi:uncharacterized protein YodC (DUF2158 family)
MVKVYKMEIVFVDHNNVGSAEAIRLIDNARLPNHISPPTVIACVEREISWSDSHPLHKSDMDLVREAARKLFQNEPRFKVGDVVQLKSGGLPMTVSASGDSSVGPWVTCQWFKDDGLNADHFYEDSLERVNDIAQGVAIINGTDLHARSRCLNTLKRMAEILRIDSFSSNIEDMLECVEEGLTELAKEKP